MAKGFECHASWSDLNNPESNLVKFLKSEMADSGTGKLSVHKLRAIAVLWCEGDKNEKVHEFYENMQRGAQEQIAASDKDFRPNLVALLNFATEMVFRLEPEYT